MESVLVPVDFSPGMRRIIRQGVLQARAFRAKLWLLHVAAPEPDFVTYASDPPVLRDQVAEGWKKEHRELGVLAEEIAAEGIDVTPLMVQGPTVEKILDEAEKLSAGLIVVGSHGHGLLHRALLGSTSEELVRKSPLPLLIVPIREA